MLKYNRSVHYSQTVREAEALSMLPQGQRTGSHPRLQPGKRPLSVGFGRGRSVSWFGLPAQRGMKCEPRSTSSFRTNLLANVTEGKLTSRKVLFNPNKERFLDSDK